MVGPTAAKGLQNLGAAYQYPCETTRARMVGVCDGASNTQAPGRVTTIPFDVVDVI